MIYREVLGTTYVFMPYGQHLGQMFMVGAVVFVSMLFYFWLFNSLAKDARRKREEMEKLNDHEYRIVERLRRI